MSGTGNLARSPWLVKSQTLEHNLLLLNQYSVLLHSRFYPYYISVATVPHQRSLSL